MDLNGVAGARSAYRLVTTMVFTDTLQAGAQVRGLHVGQLRQAIDAVRASAGLSPAWPGNYGPATGLIRASHVTDLRMMLSDARGTLGLPLLTFTDPVLTAQQSVPRAAHFNELRNGVNGVN